MASWIQTGDEQMIKEIKKVIKQENNNENSD